MATPSATRSIKIAERLALSEPFAGLPADALASAAKAARVRPFDRGCALFHQGDADARAHVLISGAVRIAQSGADGGQTVVRFIRPGQIFGSVSLFTNHLYPADAVAVLDGAEASWAEADIRTLMAAHPTIAANLLRVVGERLQEAQERLRELATQSVERRLARALLRLVDSRNDSGAIEFPIRRRDLADLIGASLYTVSRLVSAWTRAGLIETRGRRMRLRRWSDLACMAEPGMASPGAAG